MLETTSSSMLNQTLAIKAGSQMESKRNPKVELARSRVKKKTFMPPSDMTPYAASGATIHCLHNKHAFEPGTLVVYEGRTVMLARNTSVEVNFWPDVQLSFPNADIGLIQALFIPSLEYSLVSTGRLADTGIKFHLRHHEVVLKLEQNEFTIEYACCGPNSRTYVLPLPCSQLSSVMISVSGELENELWHGGLAHVNRHDLTSVYRFSDDGPKLSELSQPCRACHLAKAVKLPFPGR